MTEELEQISPLVWDQLHSAIDNPDHPYWLLNLATVTQDMVPESRLVVIREVDAEKLTLSFHTDVRSKKWQQLQSNPHSALTGYDPQNRIQIRIQGIAELFDFLSEKNQWVWDTLSPDRKKLCTGDTPASLVNPKFNPDAEFTENLGVENFGIIQIRVQLLDWLILDPKQHKRAIIDYSSSKVIKAHWVNP